MMEIQVRIPCPQPIPERVWGCFRCPTCGHYANRENGIEHSLIIKWMSLEDAVQAAHVETTKKGHGTP